MGAEAQKAGIEVEEAPHGGHDAPVPPDLALVKRHFQVEVTLPKNLRKSSIEAVPSFQRFLGHCQRFLGHPMAMFM